MKLEKYPYGERVVLTSIALIWISIDIELAIMLLGGFTIRPVDFKLLALSALALVAVYVIYTEFRWRKENTEGSDSTSGAAALPGAKFRKLMEFTARIRRMD